MHETNLNAIKEHVHVQYGDLTGVIQLDGFSNISSLYTLCEDHQFSTEDIFIIGIGLGESSLQGIGSHNELCCSIFYVEKATFGNSFEEIESHVKRTGILEVKKKTFYIPYQTITKYIKRFDCIALSNIAASAVSLKIDEDANL